MRNAILVVLSVFLGVAGATTTSCAIGLSQGTNTWCGLVWLWPLGTLLAIPTALLIGVPAYFFMRTLGLARWWQYLLGGILVAAPLWVGLSQPFTSIRWQQSGLFDTINYLGSGALGAVAFWWLIGRKDRAGPD